jgi:hypothetical protein
MRKQLEAALRDNDVGLVETQKLDRGKIAGLRSQAPPGVPTARLAGRRVSTAGPLADELEPGAPPEGEGGDPMATRGMGRAGLRRAAQRRRRILPLLAVALAVLVGGGGAALWMMRRAPRYRPTVDIAGVAITRGITAGKLVAETDGALDPTELARLYTSTLDALRLYVETQQLHGAGDKLPIADPIDVVVAVPAAALCEPTAYLDHQVPPSCAAEPFAIAIGARGTHRLMVVSERAQLIPALRRGVARAACEFSPVSDKQLREVCDITARFAGSTN